MLYGSQFFLFYYIFRSYMIERKEQCPDSLLINPWKLPREWPKKERSRNKKSLDIDAFRISLIINIIIIGK